MKTTLKWLLGLLVLAGVLLAAAGAALAWWLSGDGLRTQVQILASERLGLPVRVAKLSLDVFPLPSLVAQGVAIETKPAISAERIELRPAWQSLLGWGGAAAALELHALTLSGVKLPQLGLDQLQQSLSKMEQAAQVKRKTKAENPSNESAGGLAVALGVLAIPQQIALDRLTWQSAANEILVLSGRVQFNAQRDQAQLQIQVGGGQVTGPLRVTGWPAVAGRPLVLRGELLTRDVDLAALPGLRMRLSGRLSATTTLDASAPTAAQWGAVLQTRTQFNVSSPVLKGIDLTKAVRTLGLSRGGETALSQLSGELGTRGAGAAMQLNLSDLKANSSLLSASGAVAVGAASRPGAARALSGKVSVDLLGGEGLGKAVGAVVGIPLEISGTTETPEVKPTRGAMIGGAIGSVVAPVLGTGAGAKLGDKAGEKLGALKERLFGK